MQKENTNWSKYSDDSIDFILSQSEKLMQEIFVSYRENTNKSYGALAIYVATLSYSINKIIELKIVTQSLFYIGLTIGTSLSIILLFINLYPQKMNFIGSYKSLLCQDYYENNVNKNEQIREYKIQQIESLDYSVKINMSNTITQIKLFKSSVAVFVSTLIIIFFLFCFFG